MPVTKSAAKRARQTIKRHQRNLRLKRVMQREVKAVLTAIAAGQKDVPAKLSVAQKAIDKAAKNNILHKNKAARKKSQLAKAASDKPKPAAKAPVKAKAKPAAKEES